MQTGLLQARFWPVGVSFPVSRIDAEGDDVVALLVRRLQEAAIRRQADEARALALASASSSIALSTPVFGSAA